MPALPATAHVTSPLQASVSPFVKRLRCFHEWCCPLSSGSSRIRWDLRLWGTHRSFGGDLNKDSPRPSCVQGLGPAGGLGGALKKLPTASPGLGFQGGQAASVLYGRVNNKTNALLTDCLALNPPGRQDDVSPIDG